MKINNILKYSCAALSISLLASSCSDLNQEPKSTASPDIYFNTESQLQSYVNNLYAVRNSDGGTSQTFQVHGNWSYGSFGDDNQTDNMTNKNYDNKYIPGEWKVGQNGGDWDFGFIYKCNYFFDNVLPKIEAGKVTGNSDVINQYVGEVYFFRAYEYFKKLKAVGDFPIVTTTLANNMDSLTTASKRAPRTDVAHFILADLDKAISLLKNNPEGKKTRISKNVALQFKSRVALNEGTWLKYFKGTPFVPNGPGWPGAAKDYNKSYQFPKGSIEGEIDFFLGEAMSSAKQVADNVALVSNNGVLQQAASDQANPYLDMFSNTDMSGYSEVLLWREYSRALGITHNVPIAAQVGNYVIGLTRGYVDNFLMANGLPIYANGSGYAGDDQIADVRKNRDGRLWLFLKEPGQTNILFNVALSTRGNLTEKYPNITTSNGESGYGTGYSLRKGGTFDGAQLSDNGGCFTGAIAFRAVESYLNYIEASYEKNGSIDGDAAKYWKQIRDRAKVDNDYQKTIAATVMSKEAENDWAAYSAGSLIDPTLYNIRRERRSELLAEGFRMSDLKRWRALDQLKSKPYHLEGFKLWGPMQNEPEYKNKDGNSIFVYGTKDSNVSSPSQSIYLRPQEVNPNSLIYGKGCSWALAHYLNPIAIQHLLITGNGDPAASPIYQNPYWPTRANEGAQQ